MKNKIKVATTSFIDRVYIVNSSTGAPLTGLAYNTAGLTFYYIKIFDTSATAVTLANCTLGTYTSGGFKEVDATNLPGLYEVHYPNAMLSSATKVHAIIKGATNMLPVAIEIELDAVNYQSNTNFGLSCLPTANPGSANGLLRMNSGSSGDVSVLSGVIACSVASGGITSGSFATGAITATAIASDAITAAKIASGSITSAKFAAGAIDATAIASGAIDADALATDAVTEIWSVAVPGSFASGTAAYVLGNIATGTPPTKEAIATEVWSKSLPGSFTSGQAGYILPNISGGGGSDPWSVALPGAYASGTAGYIVGTNLNATVSSRSAASALSSLQSDVTAIGVTASAILDDTETSGVVVAAGSKSGYSLTQSFPANFASLAITAGGAVTAGTVSDKSGYSLTQSFPSNFASMAITVGGAVTVGTNSDKTGYSLTTNPPTLSQITDGILNTALTESYAADGAQGTLTQIAYALQQNAFDASISGTTKTVKKLNGSTTALTLTLDNATTPTSISRTG